MIDKSAEMLCGPACINYILHLEKRNNKVINTLTWCCDLACALKEMNFNVDVRCFNSKLYNDSQKFSDSKFDGFTSINRYLKKKPIKELELTVEDLKQEIKHSKYLICNVSSKLFNNDNNMTGGHYILVLGENLNFVKIINPRKTVYEQTEITLQKLIDCMKDFGSWRILIN